MAIVATYKFGKCTAMVDDSCIVKDKKEVDKILGRIYEIYMASELAKAKEAMAATKRQVEQQEMADKLNGENTTEEKAKKESG